MRQLKNYANPYHGNTSSSVACKFVMPWWAITGITLASASLGYLLQEKKVKVPLLTSNISKLPEPLQYTLPYSFGLSMLILTYGVSKISKNVCQKSIKQYIQQ